MLTTLMLVAAQALPIMPPGAVPKPAPSFSPKYTEQLASSGTKMVRVQAPAPYVPPTGFVITNLSVQNGVVSLAWQQGQPLFQIQGGELHGWTNLGPLTTAQSKSFPQGTVPHFFRITQSNSMPLTLNSTNQPRLQWQHPEIDMSDSIANFHVYRTTDQAVSQTEPPGSWTDISGALAGTATSFPDTTVPSPPLYYTVRGTTANGVKIPYVGQQLSLNTSGDVVWKTEVTATSSHWALATTSDGAGNVYTVGQFAGSLTIQGQTITTSANTWHMFLAKFSPSGSLVFLKKVGVGTGNINPVCITVNSTGTQIVVGGKYNLTENFGGQDFTSVGDYDAFVVKYDGTGNHIWSESYGTPGDNSATDHVGSVVMDINGNVIASGYLSITFTPAAVIFGGLSHTFYYAANTLYLAKFSSAGSGGRGVGIWVSNITSKGPAELPQIAYNSVSDKIIFYCRAEDVILGGDQFGVGGTEYKDTSSLSVWNNADGTLVNSSQASTGDHVVPTSLSLDRNQNIIATGFFYSFEFGPSPSVDFGTGPITALSPAGAGYVVKYSGTDLHCLWATWIGNTGYLQSYDYASLRVRASGADGSNDIYVGGNFKQYASFYDASNKTLIRKTLNVSGAGGADGNPDIFVAKYSGATGNLASLSSGGLWVLKYGSDGISDYCHGFTFSGSPVIAGLFTLGGLDCVLMKVAP